MQSMDVTDLIYKRYKRRYKIYRGSSLLNKSYERQKKLIFMYFIIDMESKKYQEQKHVRNN